MTLPSKHEKGAFEKLGNELVNQINQLGNT